MNTVLEAAPEIYYVFGCCICLATCDQTFENFVNFEKNKNLLLIIYRKVLLTINKVMKMFKMKLDSL